MCKWLWQICSLFAKTDVSVATSNKRPCNAAGDVTYGYHRFGPTDKSRPVKHPVVLLSGFSTRMYIWPIPVRYKAPCYDQGLADHLLEI